MGAVMGDVDNDGDLDIYVANYNGQNRLWINGGDGSFTASDISGDEGDSYGAVMGDVDNDGDLDIYVANDGQNRLWINGGSGSFTASDISGDTGYSFDAVMGDVDNDGDLDIYVANYNGQQNRLWINNGFGSFTASDISGDEGNSRCAVMGDVDNDGDLDIYVANYGQQNRLWINGETYYYRTADSLEDSSWSTVANWEVSINGQDNWQNAANVIDAEAPNAENSFEITIRSDITIDASYDSENPLSIDQTVIEADAAITVVSGAFLTVTDGEEDTDLTANGSIIVNYTSAESYGTLLIASGAAVDSNSSFTVDGTLSFDDGGDNNGTLNLSGASITINALTAGSGTIVYDGENQGIAAVNYNNLTVCDDSSAAGDLDVDGAFSVGDGVTLTLNGTGTQDIGTANQTTGTIVYAGTDAVIDSAVTYNNLTVNADASSASTLTAAALTVGTDITLDTENLSVTTSTSNSGTIKVSGAALFGSSSVGGTVVYDGGNQNIADTDYYNLTLSGSGTKILNANLEEANRINTLIVDASSETVSFDTNGYDVYATTLTLTSDGSITDSGVGETTDLNISGTSTINGNITTTGNQTYSGAVTSNSSIQLAAGEGNITSENTSNDFTAGISIVSANNVNITNSNALTLGASSISGSFTVVADGAITQSGALGVTGTTDITAGAANNITLDNASNDFIGGVRIVSGNNVSLTDLNALVIGNANGAGSVSGNLTVTAGGAITQVGALGVTGTTDITAGAANNITLDNASNEFIGGVRIVSGNNVSLTDLNALVIGNVNGAGSVSGNLTVTAGGAISQVGALGVTGTTDITAGAANNITLDNASNDFTGGVRIVSGNNVSLTDLNALVIGNANGAGSVSGNLAVTAGGAITQVGAFSVSGTTDITASGSESYFINGFIDDFEPDNWTSEPGTGSITITPSEITLVSGNSGTRDDTDISITIPADCTQIEFTCDYTTDDDPNYDTFGYLLDGEYYQLTNGSGGDSQSGTVSITVSAGQFFGFRTYTDDGQYGAATTVVADFVATFRGDEALYNITLDNASNNFTGAVSIISGNNISLRDSGTLNLATLNVSGNITVNSSTKINLSNDINIGGTINKQGNSDFDTSGYNIISSGIILNEGTFNSDGDDGNWDIDGNVEVANNATLTATSGNFYAGGNWTIAENGTFENNSGTVIFNGTSKQQITSSGNDFNNVTIANEGATVKLMDNATVSGTLELTDGKGLLDTNSNTLTVNGSIQDDSVGENFDTDHMIIVNGTGKLHLTVSPNTSYLFPIGTYSEDKGYDYSPMTIEFTEGDFTGDDYVEVTAAPVKYSENPCETNFLSRYWNATSSGVVNYEATVTCFYDTADIVLGDGATENDIYGAEYLSDSWIKPTAVDTDNHTFTIAGVTSLAVFSGIAAPYTDSVIINPFTSQTITAGNTIQFSAVAYDQYGNIRTDTATDFTWTNTTGTGLFNTTAAGTYSVNAAYGNVSSINVSVTVNSNSNPTRPDVNNGEMINDSTQYQTKTSWRNSIDSGASDSIDSSEGFEPNEVEGPGLVMRSLITLDASVEAVANGEYTMDNFDASAFFLNNGEYEININTDYFGVPDNSNQEFNSQYDGLIDLSCDFDIGDSLINNEAIAAYNDRHPLFKTELDMLLEKI